MIMVLHLFIAAVVAGLVHLGGLFALPHTTTDDVFSTLSREVTGNNIAIVPEDRIRARCALSIRMSRSGSADLISRTGPSACARACRKPSSPWFSPASKAASSHPSRIVPRRAARSMWCLPRRSNSAASANWMNQARRSRKFACPRPSHGNRDHQGAG